jgi:hypothetical protein
MNVRVLRFPRSSDGCNEDMVLWSVRSVVLRQAGVGVVNRASYSCLASKSLAVRRPVLKPEDLGPA